MKKQLTKPILLIATIALLFSCGEDNSPSLVQNEFLGTWVEKHPERLDGFPDTIVFQDNGLIGKHHLLKGDNYRFENDSLIIDNNGSGPSGTHKYLLIVISENEIIIRNLLDRDISNVIAFIPYIKLEEQTK